MGLKLTRTVNSKTYGGFNLDGTSRRNLEATYDHCIWIREVSNRVREKSIVVNIVSNQGVEEIYFPQTKSHLIDDGSLYLNNFPTRRLTQIEGQILLQFNGTSIHWFEQKRFCEVCGRGDPEAKREVPAARLEIFAPPEYQIIRDDAKKINGRKD